MTLDKQIILMEELLSDDDHWSSKKAKSEYRQLLKWLKDYKRLLERPTGAWINTTFLGEHSLKCNQCGKAVFGVVYYNFCPNCGARMIGGYRE